MSDIEPEEPTHTLVVTVPLRLVGPFSSVVVKDALTTVLSMLRVSGSIVDNPQVELVEREP